MEYCDDEMCANPRQKCSTCADGRFDASVSILCIHNLLKEYERLIEGLKLKNFFASFITNSFQERDISENLYLLCSRKIWVKWNLAL
jgi:hypothetical protein